MRERFETTEKARNKEGSRERERERESRGIVARQKEKVEELCR